MRLLGHARVLEKEIRREGIFFKFSSNHQMKNILKGVKSEKHINKKVDKGYKKGHLGPE